MESKLKKARFNILTGYVIWVVDWLVPTVPHCHRPQMVSRSAYQYWYPAK